MGEEVQQMQVFVAEERRKEQTTKVWMELLGLYESDLMTVWHVNTKLNTQGWYEGPQRKNVDIK